MVFDSSWIWSIRKCLLGHHRSRMIHASYTSSCKNKSGVSSRFTLFNLWKLSTSFFHTSRDPGQPSKCKDKWCNKLSVLYPPFQDGWIHYHLMYVWGCKERKLIKKLFSNLSTLFGANLLIKSGQQRDACHYKCRHV